MEIKKTKQHLIEPGIASQEFTERLIKRIHTLQKRRIFGGMFVWGFLNLSSLGLVLYAGNYFIEMATKTGFSQYLSLLFSDGATLLSSWKEFISLLVESIPLTETILVLVSVGIFVGLCAKTIERGKISYAFN